MFPVGMLDTKSDAMPMNIWVQTSRDQSFHCALRGWASVNIAKVENSKKLVMCCIVNCEKYLCILRFFDKPLETHFETLVSS